jgi:peroxiredoxin-like protein
MVIIVPSEAAEGGAMEETSHVYKVSATWLHDRNGWAEAPGVESTVKFSAAPEFGGRAGAWSPEQLLVLAASSCFLSAFLFFAERNGIPLASFRVDGEGALERMEGKGYRFAHITLRPFVILEHEKDVAEAEKLLEKAQRACIVANSLGVAVRVEARVEVGLPAFDA